MHSGGFALIADIMMAEEAPIGCPQVRRDISTFGGRTLAPPAPPWLPAMGYLAGGKPVAAPNCPRFGVANEIMPKAQILEARRETRIRSPALSPRSERSGSDPRANCRLGPGRVSSKEPQHKFL